MGGNFSIKESTEKKHEICVQHEELKESALSLVGNERITFSKSDLIMQIQDFSSRYKILSTLGEGKRYYFCTLKDLAYLNIEYGFYRNVRTMFPG